MASTGAAAPTAHNMHSRFRQSVPSQPAQTCDDLVCGAGTGEVPHCDGTIQVLRGRETLMEPERSGFCYPATLAFEDFLASRSQAQANMEVAVSILELKNCFLALCCR